MNACAWCRQELPATARKDSIFCGRRCRQTAFRLRRRHATASALTGALVFAYADPPYPGHARIYQDQPSYRGEVDHHELIASLTEDRELAGWALSTSAKALRHVLPLCPPGARVCAWVKPHGAHPKSHGLHNCWEPLIVVGGRQIPPGQRDWLSALPARRGGDLPGRKPIAFCAWLFRCLGMLPGDELRDRYPGTGIVGRAWDEACRSAPASTLRRHVGQVLARHVAEDLPSPLQQRLLLTIDPAQAPGLGNPGGFLERGALAGPASPPRGGVLAPQGGGQVAPSSTVEDACSFCDRRARWTYTDGTKRCDWHLHGAAPAALTADARRYARGKRT